MLLEITGVLSSRSSVELRQAVAILRHETYHHLILDIDGIPSLDSGGVSVLAEVSPASGRGAETFGIISANARFRKFFELAPKTERWTVFSSEDEAVEYLKSRPVPCRVGAYELASSA